MKKDFSNILLQLLTTQGFVAKMATPSGSDGDEGTPDAARRDQV